MLGCGYMKVFVLSVLILECGPDICVSPNYVYFIAIPFLSSPDS